LCTGRLSLNQHGNIKLTSNRQGYYDQSGSLSALLGPGPRTNCAIALQIQLDQELPKFQLVLEDQADVVHPPYQWTIKQIVGHLSDTERVFAYRALRFARGDTTPLPGFDQNAYMDAANFNDRSYQELVEELTLVRQATIHLFRTLPAEALDREGPASDFTWTVRSLGRCCIGHVRHHLQIVQRRVSTI